MIAITVSISTRVKPRPERLMEEIRIGTSNTARSIVGAPAAAVFEDLRVDAVLDDADGTVAKSHVNAAGVRAAVAVIDGKFGSVHERNTDGGVAVDVVVKADVHRFVVRAVGAGVVIIRV